ncbi:flagellar biosynthetic protein FliR [Rhodospirillum rubrum]|uniref:Flagellar biosynthetic protein FliR n=1 Tax=Rhodospirillum rubrum (strain ATCC 11170 / ATH 1.1.1 / DSM 467 / LMG 4362 / NCIMB 8255 / S1) TaxID=269796 RepID=Q2RQH6_RHORT|nr:flagellar biosynthetic protein FliR [Rhodospirillum rubrum]ABC23619.1 Flagellar biosynthesis protein FliR [Rhodospirillum rubrum ATCC 11170]AEO49357.1 flagellar biosynthesis protein FliR [Rhodospirillum rubrum F11]MBK5955296.1 flagellar biosynthetic protein FliR [Rhodospirillum rubrum]QXG79580.1 flagellar type III secretion system protein FliR [Rhodospirillum rubrum]
MLDAFLNQNLFHFLLVFVRLGTAMLVLPGLSSTYVSVNIRILLAVTITLVALPTVGAALPPAPDNTAFLVLLIAVEATIGVFLGMMAQFLLVPVSFAGNIMGFSTGLMMAQAFDPTTAQQSALIAGFLGEVAMVMVFVTGMHHLMIEAVVNSYDAFPPGQMPDTGDMVQLLVTILSSGFRLGLQLAAPFIIYAIIFNATLGVIARLMPQLNVLFVAMPAQILFGLALLMTTVPFLIYSFLGHFERGLINLAMP